MSESLSSRRFFVHPGHGTIGVLAAPAAFGEPQGRPQGVRACVLPGEAAEGWNESSGRLADYLCGDGRVESCTTWSEGRDGADPADFDCLVLLGRPAVRDPRRLGQVIEYCRRGRPIVALCGAGFALPGWTTFAEDVLGGRDRGRVDHVRLEIRPAESARQHPVLLGVEPFFAQGDPLGEPSLADDATVLLLGHSSGFAKAVAWVRRHRGGRVFCATFGRPDDFHRDDFLRLLANAVCWAGQ